VFGAISAVSSLLEAAISMTERIRKAHEQQKDLANLLSTHHDELRNMCDIVQIVKDEESLRTAAVTSQLVNIEAVATKLVDCLKTLDPGTKSSLRQFAHQLVRGSEDEKKLERLMDKLSRAKSSLSLRKSRSCFSSRSHPSAGLWRGKRIEVG
jgi:hypothetical protein